MKNSRHKKTPVAPTTRAYESNAVNDQENNVMTNTTTVVDMRKFVEARDGKAFTSSQNVAEAFGKQHYHVLAKVRELDCSDHFLTHNFSWVQFEHRGNRYDAVEMTKDGFVFLVMGFTGKKAAAIKEGYIAAFNWMAGQLGINPTDLVHTVIGSTGELILDRVIEQKGYKIPSSLQRSFKHTMKSRLRARFNVQKTALIPADKMSEACNFVASYVIEGEYLPKQTEVQFDLNKSGRYPLSFNHKGEQQIDQVPDDAYVLSQEDFLKGIAHTPGDIPISTDGLFDFAIAALNNLRLRAQYQSRRAKA